MPNSDDEELALEVAGNPMEKTARAIILGGYDLTVVTDLVRNGDVEALKGHMADQVPPFWGWLGSRVGGLDVVILPHRRSGACSTSAFFVTHNCTTQPPAHRQS